MGETENDLDKICEILDKLTLDALLLMQDEIEMKLNVENAMSGGETHLAKSRYILGQANVSALQLPTENSYEFSACLKVESTESLLKAKVFDLRETKKCDDKTVQEPLRWFGYLVPQNLNFAQKMFRQAVQWSVQAANVQNRLYSVLQSISNLKDLKNSISSN